MKYPFSFVQHSVRMVFRQFLYHSFHLPTLFQGFKLTHDYPSKVEVNLKDRAKSTCGPIYWHGLTLITWISNYIHYKVWHEISYTVINFNSYPVDVGEWISNFVPMDVCNHLSILGLKLKHVKAVPDGCSPPNQVFPKGLSYGLRLSSCL